MSDFHEPEEPEREEIEKILRRHKLDNVLKQFKKSCDIAYSYQGNFTTALVRSGKELFIGVAKRRPTDADNFEIAERTALSRAVRSVPLEFK